jgi:hypothetical protein
MITLSNISNCKFYSKHIYVTHSEDAFYKDKGNQRMTLTSMDEENRWSLSSLNSQVLGTTAKNIITTTTWHPGFMHACACVY